MSIAPPQKDIVRPSTVCVGVVQPDGVWVSISRRRKRRRWLFASASIKTARVFFALTTDAYLPLAGTRSQPAPIMHNFGPESPTLGAVPFRNGGCLPSLARLFQAPKTSRLACEAPARSCLVGSGFR